jgi:hypothetical protein
VQYLRSDFDAGFLFIIARSRVLYEIRRHNTRRSLHKHQHTPLSSHKRY